MSERIQILQGDCRETLRTLPEQSANCVVTSIPYWGLRDYGCEGQLGQEETPEEFIEAQVGVFRECRRVLRDDGTVWLNVGDSYAHDNKWGGASGEKNYTSRDGGISREKKKTGLKNKDLVGIPWMLAFALRKDGWYLRSEVIWGKPNGMPESVRDRPTRAHETVFLLAKSPDYYYDYDAVKLPPLPSTISRLEQNIDSQAASLRANGGGKSNGTMKAVMGGGKQRGHSRRHDGFNDRWDAMEKQQQQNGCALRDVWWIAPAQSRDAHFAVMPENLAKLCILAGCPADGAVLDPFAGSGTTGIAAAILGRKAVLCELNPDYVEIMRKRFDRTCPLFV